MTTKHYKKQQNGDISVAVFYITAFDFSFKYSLFAFNNARIETVRDKAKSIFIMSQKGEVILPQKSNKRRVRYAEKTETIRGATSEGTGARVNLIFFLNRIKDRRKLYPSIITITTA